MLQIAKMPHIHKEHGAIHFYNVEGQAHQEQVLYEAASLDLRSIPLLLKV